MPIAGGGIFFFEIESTDCFGVSIHLCQLLAVELHGVCQIISAGTRFQSIYANCWRWNSSLIHSGQLPGLSFNPFMPIAGGGMFQTNFHFHHFERCFNPFMPIAGGGIDITGMQNAVSACFNPFMPIAGGGIVDLKQPFSLLDMFQSIYANCWRWNEGH